MATATRGRRRGTKATAPVVEVVEEDDAIEDLDEDVEELELDEPEELEEEPAPKRRAKKTAPAAKAAPAKAAPAKRAAKPAPADEDEDEDAGPVYDTNWLAEYINETAGTDYDSRALRMLLRKLAHDGTIAREVGTDRSRYTFPRGAADPIVKAVLKSVRSGGVEVEKAASVAKAKETAAVKKAPAKAAAKATPAKKAAAPARRRRSAPAEVEEIEDDDDE